MNNEIVGKLKFRDYLCCVLHKEKKIIILQVIITVIIVFLLLPKNTSLILGLFLYVFFAFLSVIFMCLVIFNRVRKNYKTLDKRFHKKIIKINEDGIEYGTKGNPGIFQWSDIRKGVFLKEMILLYISTEEAILIPRHFFSTLEEAKKWEFFINNYLLG